VIKKFYKCSHLLPPLIQVVLRNFLGRNKERELFMLKRIIKKGDVVVDVGAHLGIYTYKLRKLVGKNGTVIGLEPQVELSRYLSSAFQIFRNVTIINSAAHKVNSTKVLFTPIHNGSIATGGASLQKRSIDNEITKITTIKIDSLNLARCSFIKIDVEGGELGVLEGSLQTLSRLHPSLLIEIDFTLSGKNVANTISLLKRLKYKPFLIEKNAFISLDYKEFKTIAINRKFGRDTLNFFFI
jgi:FkbM family methyltransferase